MGHFSCALSPEHDSSAALGGRTKDVTAPRPAAAKAPRPSSATARILSGLRVPGAITLLALSLLVARPSWGEAIDDGTRNAARALAEQGKAQFDDGAYERARELFQRAYPL